MPRRAMAVGRAQHHALEGWLSEAAGHAVHVALPCGSKVQKWSTGQRTHSCSRQTNGVAQVHCAEPGRAFACAGQGTQVVPLSAYSSIPQGEHGVSLITGLTKPSEHALHSKFKNPNPSSRTHWLWLAVMALCCK